MHFGPLCMQLTAPISFFLLFGTNSNPEKVQHFLVSPNSIKIAPNGFFLVPQRDLRCFYAGAVAPKSALFCGTHPTPLKTETSTLSTKWQTFYTINFFSDSPEWFAFLGPLASIFSAPEHVQHLFQPLGMPQNGFFFLKDRTYRGFFVLLHKRNFFRMVPKGLNAFWTFVRAVEAPISFLASGNASKCVFSLRIAHITISLYFCTKGIFF